LSDSARYDGSASKATEAPLSGLFCYLAHPDTAAKNAHIRSAQPGRRLNQGVEHSPEIERRATNNLKHICGRGPLLQRLGKVLPSLGEFAPVFFELLFQIGTRLTHLTDARSHLRSG